LRPLKGKNGLLRREEGQKWEVSAANFEMIKPLHPQGAANTMSTMASEKEEAQFDPVAYLSTTDVLQE